MAWLKSAFHVLKQQKILYKLRLILNAEDENSQSPSVFFFMYQVHERKKKLSFNNQYIIQILKQFRKLINPIFYDNQSII